MNVIFLSPKVLKCQYSTSHNSNQNFAGCQYNFSISDEVCFDQANNELCEFDGGDCCFDKIDDRFCQDCICNDTGLRHPSMNEGGNTFGLLV